MRRFHYTSARAGGCFTKHQNKKEYIHPSKFVRPAKPPQADDYQPINSFVDFNLHPLLQRNINQMGYQLPSPIQDKTIPLGLSGKDIIGIANTGTGKTAAFAIPVLQRLLKDNTSRAIILAPTRELALQIEEQCRGIAKGSGLNGAVLMGGVAIGPQTRDLQRRPRIVIGTPGRVKDHLERQALNLAGFNVVVLDEVDRMLDMGFVHDIRGIISQTSRERQNFFYSATLDDRVRGIINDFSTDPVCVSVASSDTSESVDQNVVQFNSVSDKIDKLHDLLAHRDTFKALVFDDTHRSVERLYKELESRGFSAGSIHGGKSQPQRQRVLKKFKDSEIKVLVATDVAARGLDVSDITHVVNYSSPQTYSDYIHRIGRTGRAGKIGYAYTFVSNFPHTPSSPASEET